MMKIEELLAYFDEGRSFGDDPAIILAMRAYIQENRRLLGNARVYSGKQASAV